MFRKVYSQKNPLLGKAQVYRVAIDGIDVTRSVIDEITLVEERGLLPELTFTLRDGEYWLERLPYGSAHEITFSGGSMNPSNQFAQIFKGVLFNSKGSFSENGVTATVTAFGSSWRGGSNNRTYYYPSSNSVRVWARKESITLHEILVNLVREIDSSLVIDLMDIKNITFTKEKPLKQNQTDWNFLLFLAQRSKAIVWEENKKIYISEIQKLKPGAKNMRKGISFIYQNPLRPIQPLPNQIMVSTLTVNEDSEAQNTFIRSKANSDGSVELKEFKLDEVKFAKEMRTNPSRMNRIFNQAIFNSSSLSDEELNEFFIEYEPKSTYRDDPFVEGDNAPFIGKTCSFSIPGNVDILAYQYYPIYNISRLSSTDTNNWWFLQKLEHRWGSNSFESKLDFIR